MRKAIIAGNCENVQKSGGVPGFCASVQEPKPEVEDIKDNQEVMLRTPFISLTA